MTANPVIYIVDDDPVVLASLEALLLTQQFEVRSFSNAQLLLEKIRPTDVGCIITDLQMPEMDGIALQANLVERASHLSLIMVTGYANVPVTVEVMKRGAVSLLEKPYDAIQLIAEVKRAVTVSRQSFEIAQQSREALEKIKQLTAEELSIMECAVSGLPNKAISHNLAISGRTIDRRRQSALRKTNVNSIGEFAVLLATAKKAGEI